MLAESNGLTEPADSSEELQVVLPDDLARNWKEAGYEPSTPFEERTAARLRVRQQGRIEFKKQPIAVANSGEVGRQYPQAVLVKDICRGGCAIYCHGQLFPGEEYVVRFGDHAVLVRAVRCRKIAEKCFEVGGKILEVVFD